MFTKLAFQSLVASTIFGLFLGLSTSVALAGETVCDPKNPKSCPPPDECSPKNNPKDCIPICHNIGGPRDLGANCEATGNCFVEGIELGVNDFLGIIIGVNFENNLNALLAHIKHGDGPIQEVFDPPLHLASVIGPHQASNVECRGTRVIPQPEEPGN